MSIFMTPIAKFHQARHKPRKTKAPPRTRAMQAASPPDASGGNLVETVFRLHPGTLGAWGAPPREGSEAAEWIAKTDAAGCNPFVIRHPGGQREIGGLPDHAPALCAGQKRRITAALERLGRVIEAPDGGHDGD